MQLEGVGKMSKKVLVQKSDIDRILHTEVLPYELPVILSNSRLHQYSKTKKSPAPTLLKKLLNDDLQYSIPFEYSIRQGATKRRVLSLIHPSMQIKFVDFYKSNTELILSLCGKSAFSLRYPSKVASYFYEHEYAEEDDSLKTNIVDEEPEAFGTETRYSSSYFYYARYGQLFKFIDSKEYLDLESKFTHLIKFDINRCFPSIYTHSISWAVKGKEFSKEHKGSFSFDSNFDNLMTQVNYQETNGIVVGPEFSRIFAEIILQQIDLDIFNTIKEKGIQNSKYAIRRYVDDYFLFTRDEVLSNTIFEIANNCLKNYKLYVNESKTDKITLPFLTPQTIAKTDILNVLHSSILSWLNHLKKICIYQQSEINQSQSHQLKTPYKLSTQLIRDLKISVKRSGEPFSVVSGRALSTITRSLYGLHKVIPKEWFPEEHKIEVQNILLVCIEIVFFFYPMDFRVRTTYLISQLIIIISRIAKADKALHTLVVSTMCNHIYRILDNLPKDATAGIELLNLLIALKEISPNELLPSEKIVELTCSEIDNTSFSKETFKNYNYFDYVVVLYYVQNSTNHEKLKSFILDSILDKFYSSKDVQKSSELTHLFLDIISCPFVEINYKRNLISIVHSKIIGSQPKASEISECYNFSNKKLGFVDWNTEVGLEKLLRKKELNSPY